MRLKGKYGVYYIRALDSYALARPEIGYCDPQLRVAAYLVKGHFTGLDTTITLPATKLPDTKIRFVELHALETSYDFADPIPKITLMLHSILSRIYLQKILTEDT